MQSLIAWKDRTWMSLSEASLSLNDWGVTQGVTIVDRLRTCNQRPLDLTLHFKRLIQNCEAIGIPTSQLEQVPDVVEQCAEKNTQLFGEQDFGLVVLVTPGEVGRPGEPTIIVHPQALNWAGIAHWHQHGQDLIVAEARNVPAACWSPMLKTRSRLHYYLADREAVSTRVHAGAVLLNTDGFITETSAASFVMIDGDGRVCAPPIADVLGSISLDRTLRLAASAGLTVIRQPISVADTAAAREILLTGTNGCLWPASSFAGRRFDGATELPVYALLRDRWMEDIQLDYVAQSKRFRHGH